jgi:hypothetical protein
LLFVAGKPFIRRDGAGGTAYGPQNCCPPSCCEPPVTPTDTPNPGFMNWLRVEPWTTGALTRLFEVGARDIPVNTTTYNYKVERRSLFGVVRYDANNEEILFEDHWATQSFKPANITLANVTSYVNMTYPFTAVADENGQFEIGTAGTTGTTTTATVHNTVVWPENPLIKQGAADMSASNRLPQDMPWEGPTMAASASSLANQATVSYELTMYPQFSWSGYWGQTFRGGGVSTRTEVATQSVNGR